MTRSRGALAVANATIAPQCRRRYSSELYGAWGGPRERGTAPSGRGRVMGDLESRRKALLRPDFWGHVAASMADGIAIVDPEGVLIEVNPAFSELFGFD